MTHAQYDCDLIAKQKDELIIQQAAVIEQMREWISETTHSLECARGMALSRMNETSIECTCFKEQALALQSCPEVLNKVRADAVTKAFAAMSVTSNDAKTYIRRIENGEA